MSESKAQKDELILEGIDVQNVSQSGMSSNPNSRSTSPLTPSQRHQSRVSAEYETRISENSWTVFTYRTRALSSQSDFSPWIV